MAKLERLSPSSHVLTLKDGTRVLFSYDTPVAAWVVNPTGRIYRPGGWWKSDKFYSRTTSQHVSRFLAGNPARAVDQAVLDSLVERV